MSNAQWGHGFHTGTKEGWLDGWKKTWKTHRDMEISEIEWVIENMAYFFTDESNVSEMAVSKAISFLIRLKCHLEYENKKEEEAEIGQ